MAQRPPRSRTVTAKGVRELLADGAGVIDPEFSRSFEAYRLPGDAVLLVFEDGRGRLYESRAELQALANSVVTGRRAHVLNGLLPAGRTFEASVHKLVAELSDQVEGSLDGSEESLDAIDDLVRRQGARTFLKPTEYPRLLAYVGEVVRRVVDGRWQMALSEDDGETWEPWIIGSSGTRHPVSLILVKELQEWDRASSIRGAIAGHLAATHRHRAGDD